MAYRPGSFSKNFAWHGNGLDRLRVAIRHGFGDSLSSVKRQRFREMSGLGRDLSLIPTNFFLHNLHDDLSVDELVLQATQYAHSIHFDRLALFAFHLNRAGTYSGSGERPAMWANEFVRERLWHDGVWRSSALSVSSLDNFFKDRIDAHDAVRVKCRSNYRHLYQLCGLMSSALPLINSGAETWFRSAIFLAWDRHVLSGRPNHKTSLLRIIDEDDLHKLLGVTREYCSTRENDLADLYASVGGVSRFKDLKKKSRSAVLLSQDSAPDLRVAEELEFSDQREVDAAVQRRIVERQEQQRNQRNATELKRLYNNCCVFCGSKLQIGDSEFYSEAAHIRPLGKPHNGPDKKSNMIVLCPNHHLQFDRGVLRLQQEGENYRIESKSANDALHEKLVTLRHELDESCVTYHHRWHS